MDKPLKTNQLQASQLKAKQLHEVTEYWNSNVANWKVANNLELGSHAFFAEVERYRFDKLDYLPKRVNYNAYNKQKVLDVGCGLATDTARFAKGGADVVAIDIAPQAIELAQANFAQRGLQAKFHVMDGQNMDFADNSFDFVYCHTVLHFTPDPQAMVREILRVLKPGGSALLMTINRNSWLYSLHRLFNMKIDYLDAPVFHRFNYTEFKQLTDIFDSNQIIVERFPIRTEVHKGLKAFLYNTCFVDLYNALPNKLIGKTGYHLLSFASKQAK